MVVLHESEEDEEEEGMLPYGRSFGIIERAWCLTGLGNGRGIRGPSTGDQPCRWVSSRSGNSSDSNSSSSSSSSSSI